MRIVVDLQACQFNSRFRGIGRYAFNLFAHMARRAGDHELLAVFNDREPGQLERMRTQLAPYLPPENIRIFCSLGGTQAVIDSPEAIARGREGELLRQAYLSSLRPDVIHTASLFDGFGDDFVGTVTGSEQLASRTAVTLYDLIPLTNPKQYLTDDVVSRWYHSRVDELRSAARLLAISDHARNEAIELLPFDKDRIVNISSGVDPFFHHVDLGDLERRALRANFGIRDRFVLYTGGFDARKNLPALVEAWSQVRARKGMQLVIAGHAPQREIDVIRVCMATHGLTDDDVLCLGYVSDEDLRRLYSMTELYVFPSLYEGFGLPVLEAMACGAPAISSWATSLPEVTGWADAMFDPYDVGAITSKIEAVLGSPDFAAALRAHAAVQARKFTWDASADSTLRALEELHESNNVARVFPVNGKPPLVVVAAQDSEASRYVVNIASVNFDATLLTPDDTQAISSCQRRVYIASGGPSGEALLVIARQYPGMVVLPTFLLGRDSRAPDRTSVYIDHGYSWLAAPLPQADYCALPNNAEWIRAATQVACVKEQCKVLADVWYGKGTSANWIILGTADSFERAVEAGLAHGTPFIRQRQVIGARELGVQKANPIFAQNFAMAAASNFPMPFGRRQLLVDVTELARSDAGTGIQRVVRNIARVLLQRRMSEFRVDPVFLDDKGQYRYARNFTTAFMGVPPITLGDEVVEYAAGDIFLGLDLVPDTARSMHIYNQMRAQGVQMHFVVYDLLPLKTTECFPKDSVDSFAQWFSDIGRVAHGFVAISRAVADEIVDELKSLRLIDKHHLPQRVAYFHLGADIDIGQGWAPSDEESAFLDELGETPAFLMVSTIEPRKSHKQVIEAFERWWAEGSQARLVIVGKQGWMVDDLMERLKSHPELGKRLVWLRRVEDGMLDELYRRVSALVVASIGEGFGLPLIEASRHGTPIIARDLPVFREVAGEHAYYFNGRTARDLLGALKAWTELREQGCIIHSTGIQRLTWSESADQLLRSFRDDIWYRDFAPDNTWAFPMHHRGIGTLAGFRIGSTLGTLGEAGFLLFGPFTYLPGGHYRFEMNGSAGDLSGATLELTSAQGKKIIATPEWLAAAPAGRLAECEFELEADAHGVEVRVRVSESTQLMVTDYRFVNNDQVVDVKALPSKLLGTEASANSKAIVVGDDATTRGSRVLDAMLVSTPATVFGGERRARPSSGNRYVRDDFSRSHDAFVERYYEIADQAASVPALVALVRYGGTAIFVDKAYERLVAACPADLRVRLVWQLDGHKGVRTFYRNPALFDSTMLREAVAMVADRVIAMSPAHTWDKVFAEAVDAGPASMPGRRRLLVDVSALAKHDARTGIQRVVRNVLLRLDDYVPEGTQVTPVLITEAGKFLYAQRFAAKFYEYPGDPLDDEPVVLRRNDIFFGLDLSAHLVPFHQQHFHAMRALDIPVSFIVHDMLPFRRPDFFSQPVVHIFSLWYQAIIKLADRIVCISKATADDLLDFCDEFRPERTTPLAVDYFPMGADLATDIAKSAAASAAELAELDRLGKSAFLTVSTIEPRKGHRQLVDAFERLWARGLDIQLVIVGRQGWMMDDLVEHLRSHPLRGDKLFWFEAVSDTVLNELYRRSAALLSPSFGEGFGLPLIEAAQHGLPIICRDLRVYREVAGDHAWYFEGDASSDLASSVEQWLALRDQGRIPDSRGIAWQSWDNATRVLWQALSGQHAYVAWEAGSRRVFPAYDPRINTLAGTLLQGQIVSTGAAGHLVYGPYVPLPAGSYRVQVNMQMDPGESLLFDAGAEQGRRVIHSSRIAARPDGGMHSYTLVLHLDQDVVDLELRLFVEEAVRCRFVSFELISLAE